MARLTLEEGGETRRFKLSSGKLTFGSGEKATLTLASGDVAELHGQIEMGPDGAVLRTAKGVMPAKVAGRPVQGAHTMKSGQAVMIGGAKLSIEYDEGEGPQRAVRAGPKTTRAGNEGGFRGERRRKPAKSSPIPTSVVVGLILVAAIGGGYALLSKTNKSLTGEEFDFDGRFNRYQREMVEDPIGARSILLDLEKRELTPQQRRLVETELSKENENLAEIDDALRNQNINKWLNSRLFNYSESKWNPKGDRAHARLFMQRAKWFSAEYPTHPELDRVKRLMERIGPVAEPGRPMDLEDLKVEVWGTTSAEPMDFSAAFAAIDKFAGSAAGPDVAATEQLRKETQALEREFYDQKLTDAAVVYDKVKYPTKYDPTTAIEDMVRLVVGCHTESLRADGAQRLLAIEEFGPAMLRAYKRTQPDRYAKLLTEPSIRAFAEKSGLL